MNLSNKYIAAEDIESVEQLEQIFEAVGRLGVVMSEHIQNTAIQLLQENRLNHIGFNGNLQTCLSTNTDQIFGCHTRIKPADILEPDNWNGAENQAWTVTDPRASLLREIANAMDENPDCWWGCFRQWYWHNESYVSGNFEDDDHFWLVFTKCPGRKIERKPHTIHLSGDVPEDVVKRLSGYVELWSAQIEDNEDTELLGYMTRGQLDDIKALLDLREVDE